MRKILIVGYFDAGNYGDDIMLLETLKYFEIHHIDYDVLFLNYKRGDTLIDESKIIDFSPYSNVKKKTKFLKIISKYSAFFWVGGTCFTNSEGDGCFTYMLISKLFGLKIGYMGIGVNYITDKQRLNRTKLLLKKSDYINLRDTKSKQNIDKMNIVNKNIKVYSDIFYLSLSDLCKLENDKYILISLRELSHLYEKQVVKQMLDSIASVIKDYYYNFNVKILPLDNQIDYKINQKLYNMLKKINIKVELIENVSVQNKTKLIENCYLNITGRLHSACVSEFLNKKVVILSYNEKINIFLNEIDCIRHSLDINQISPETLYKAISNDVNCSYKFEELINKSKQGMDDFIQYIKSI